MAQRTEELRLAWASLSGTDDRSGWQTIAIAPAGSCALVAGRRFPGNEESLLAGFSNAVLGSAEKLPEGQGFAVERVVHEQDGRTWIGLTRQSAGSIDLFCTMACDIAFTMDAEAATAEPRLLPVFLSRVRAWQEFMRRGTLPLSAESETGLFGELTILSTLLDEGVMVASAVEAWVGSLSGLRDFELGTGGIEVKSTLSTAGFPARIGSLEQLDDSVRQPLFIAGVRLRQTVDGNSLPELVEAMRDIVRGDSPADRYLAERLLAAGYIDGHSDGYSRRFNVLEIRVIEVDPSFPRLTPSLVPGGITRASYDIDLDRVLAGTITIGAALAKLGAV